MLHKRNGKIYFIWPEAKDTNHFRTLISDDWTCKFDAKIALTSERSFTIKNTGDDGKILNESTVFINSKAKTESRFNGVACFAADKNGQPDKQITYEFFLFEDQIYVLEDVNYLESFVLMKLASKRSKQDWRWLNTVLKLGTYLIIYTGPDLDGENSILWVCSTLAECHDWMRNLAKKNGLSVLYETFMLDNYNIWYIELSKLKKDPYSCFRKPDEISLWSLINNDFSRITTRRWKQLEQRIKFPVESSG
jgi:hypothetical protein